MTIGERFSALVEEARTTPCEYYGRRSKTKRCGDCQTCRVALLPGPAPEWNQCTSAQRRG